MIQYFIFYCIYYAYRYIVKKYVFSYVEYILYKSIQFTNGGKNENKKIIAYKRIMRVNACF